MGLLEELSAGDDLIIARMNSLDEAALLYDGANLRQVMGNIGDQNRLQHLGFEEPFFPEVALYNQEMTVFYWYGWATPDARFPLLTATLRNQEISLEQTRKLVNAWWSSTLIDVDFIDSLDPAQTVLDAIEFEPSSRSVGKALHDIEAVFKPDAVRYRQLQIARAEWEEQNS